jgi:hypothetical protein
VSSTRTFITGQLCAVSLTPASPQTGELTGPPETEDRVRCRAFEGFLLPLLGLVFLPFTTLFYVLAYRPVVGVSGWGWFFVFPGLLFDLGSYGGGARSRRR